MSPRQSPRLLDRVHDRIVFGHYSIWTKHAYADWVLRFARFHGNRRATELGRGEIGRFLASHPVERNIAASTQDGTLNNHYDNQQPQYPSPRHHDSCNASRRNGREKPERKD